MILPSVQVGLQTLRANPVRTLLSTLGIVMGAASLVGVLSAGDGAELLARRQIERLGMQAVGVMPKTSDLVDGLNIPRSGFPVFTIAEAKSLAARVGPSSAVALSTTAGTGMFVAKVGGPPRAATVVGVYGSLDALLGGVAVAHGRFLTDEEMTGQGTVAVVSNNLAVELAGGRSPVSVLTTPLMLQGRPWTIVGVLDEVANQRTFAVMVPLGSVSMATLPGVSALPAPPSGPGAAQRLPGVRTFLVRAPRIEDVLSVQAQVEAWADVTNPRWRRDSQVTINSQGVERLRQINQGMLIFKLLMGSFAGISLVVGGIGIMNVLLAAVAERTREIGLRKAAGARRRDIIVQFLSESVIISLAGATLGAVVGFSASTGITAFIRWRTSSPLYAAFTWQTFVVSMGTAIAVGLIFGVYPALKAARLSPVDAIRYE
jgi:putative ABC transport system permease protein